MKSNVSVCVAVAFLATVFVASGSAFGQESLPTTAGNLRYWPSHLVRLPQPNPDGEALAPSTPQWSSPFNSTAHSGLTAPAADYDPATNTMMVFGGFDWGLGGADTNAVLLYAPANGTGNWTTLIANGAAGAPAARDRHSAVYDSADNRMIVFGGEIFSSSTDLNDVWVLSNANGHGGATSWTQLSPSGPLPAARAAHKAVYDSANNRMIIFGGGVGGSFTQVFHDVWVLSNANGLGGTPAWTKLSPGGVAPNVLFTSAVYDSTNNIMTVFGGGTPTGASNAAWTLAHANGLGGTPHWTNIVANGAPGSPARRSGHTAVYDTANNRMIVFGGQPASGPYMWIGFNDVWVLANANGLGGLPVWTRLNISGPTPGTRFEHVALYDEVNNRMMVLGGNNLDAAFFVAWVLSNANGL